MGQCLQFCHQHMNASRPEGRIFCEIPDLLDSSKFPVPLLHLNDRGCQKTHQNRVPLANVYPGHQDGSYQIVRLNSLPF